MRRRADTVVDFAANKQRVTGQICTTSRHPSNSEMELGAKTITAASSVKNKRFSNWHGVRAVERYAVGDRTTEELGTR